MIVHDSDAGFSIRQAAAIDEGEPRVVVGCHATSDMNEYSPSVEDVVMKGLGGGSDDGRRTRRHCKVKPDVVLEPTLS